MVTFILSNVLQLFSDIKKKHIQIEVVNPVNPERHILVVIYLKNKSVNGKSIQNDE